MESHCIRHTDLPNTSKLFSDFVYNFERVSGFYGHAPHRVDSYHEAAAKIDFPDDRRQRLVAALREQNGESPALDLLSRPGTATVVTGQQVGLFSGPAYTIYKALTAARLAAQLTEQGIPAVPIFWLATEDHDFAEIDHCWTFDAAQQPVEFRLSRPGSADRPVGDFPLPAELPFPSLKQSLAGFPFGEDVAALVEDTYTPGKPIGDAFADLLRRLLGRFGLLFLDPLRPAVREIAAPILERAAATAPELLQRIAERNAALAQAGYHAQVHVDAETSLFFLLRQGRRIALKRQNGNYVARDVRIASSDLGGMAHELSPNALLRPVVQDYILPTVAYVGGPAELAYLAQSQVIYESLLGRMPVVMPRTGFTLLDARAAKLMKRYRLSLPDFFEGQHALSEKIAATLVPPALLQSLKETREAAQTLTSRWREQLAGFDVTLASAAEKSAAKIQYQLQKIERKAGREMLRRDERAATDTAYLQNQIFPHKHLQERFYSILPFLGRHGLDLIDGLYENVHLDCPDHLLLVV